MQRAYISALYSLMQQDRRVVSLLSDSGTDYDELMSREMPQQCYNFGISEQNKLGIAAGMAMCGKLPFVYTSGAFLAFRGYEFIRNDICYQNQNVKRHIVAHARSFTPYDGGSRGSARHPEPHYSLSCYTAGGRGMRPHRI